MKDSTILVTGGAGNIGSHIVDMCVKNDAKKVIVIDDFSRGVMSNLDWAIKNGNVVVINGNIKDTKLLNEYFKDVDYVFHQAAIRITQCAKEPRLAHEVLIDGTFNVLEACVKHKIKKLVFASSASVYGDSSYLPMDENHPFNNKTYYGAGKIANEQMTRAFREMYGLNYVGLRYFNVYGPRMDIYGYYTEVMIKWLDKMDKNEAPVIFGDGEQAMDFIYVEDVAKANILALESDIVEGVYNVGTGIMTSLNELVREMLDLTNPNLKPIHKDPEKLLIVSKRKAGIEKAKENLGFKSEVNLKEGLKKLIGWRKSNIKQVQKETSS
ncbi:MAG: NAD-dependent epimerase/dehydratase family protein [bacterium]|nr:NAD-dependent epimerase/dehydratase family protein [bacterium]